MNSTMINRAEVKAQLDDLRGRILNVSAVIDCVTTILHETGEEANVHPVGALSLAFDLLVEVAQEMEMVAEPP